MSEAGAFPPPLGLIAEVTHRCPLQCPYCSNPLDLERAAAELDTAGWLRVLDQAAEIGVLQMHFTGGSRWRGAISWPWWRMRRSAGFIRT